MNLATTKEVYEKVLSETEDFMNVLHSRDKGQAEYESNLRSVSS